MSNRAKKRRRKEARSAQRKAWYVELRLLGYPDRRIQTVMGMGNHEDIRRAYEETMRRQPKYWESVLRITPSYTDEFNFISSPAFTKI